MVNVEIAGGHSVVIGGTVTNRGNLKIFTSTSTFTVIGTTYDAGIGTTEFTADGGVGGALILTSMLIILLVVLLLIA